MASDRVFSLRAATAADAEAIARIVREELGYSAEPSAIGDVIRRCPSGSLIVVAESEGKVLGVAHAGERDSLYKGRLAELYSLAVSKVAQDSGIGSALVAEVERFYKSAGCGQIILGSRIEREAAHRFYEAKGYHKEKTHARFAKKL